jgi:hypothetical protein
MRKSMANNVACQFVTMEADPWNISLGDVSGLHFFGTQSSEGVSEHEYLGGDLVYRPIEP